MNAEVQDEQRAQDAATGRRARGGVEILTGAFVDLTETGSLRVFEDSEHLLESVFGWWAWINRSSQLVLLAHDAGRGHEAAPNVRSILEHALVLHWVVEVGDEAMAAVAALGDDNRRKLFADVRRAGWSIPPDIAPPPRTTHPQTGMVKNFADLCIAYDARTLYVPYRMLSAHVHPTPKGAEAYLEPGSLVNHASRPLQGDLTITANTLIMAARAINPLLADHPLTEAIRRAEEEFGTAVEH
jgi:hypothetical protein